MRYFTLLLFFVLISTTRGFSQLKSEEMGLREELSEKSTDTDTESKTKKKPRILYGTASYYADKFNGRKTATGHTYSHERLTAACNQLPLGTWIRVTNLRNNFSVIVQINDRLHPKNKRVVDLSKIAAQKLGYISRGLTQVKVEVLSGFKQKT